MKITTRAVQGEEMLESLYALTMYSLHSSPPFENKEDWMARVSERKGVTCHAAFENGEPMSIAASTAMTQNLRGKLFPASGVWGVATQPPARRKGYCKQTIASLLAAEREAGKVFTNLYPFRESFYQRLGYVAFPLVKIAKFPLLSLSPLLKMELEGEIDLRLIGEAYDAYRAYLAEMRLVRHGMGVFDYGDRSVANRNLVWTAQAKFDGKTEGLMLYRLVGEEPTKYHFLAIRFYYLTSRARYLLLNWVARHIDQAEGAELWLPADEYPETWLADLQIKVESASRPAMGRVLDIEKIGGMEAGAGHFSANVSDPICPWNEGAWRFEGRDGKLQVTKAAAADCEMTIQGVTALVYGTHDPQDLFMRGWGNPDPMLQAAQREIFPKMCPYLHENF
jgi:predicted acetyltransferase